MVPDLPSVRTSSALFAHRRLPSEPLRSWTGQFPVKDPLRIRLPNHPKRCDICHAFSGFGPARGGCPKPVRRPLSRRRVRVHRAASSMLWVTTIEVSPWETCNRSNRSNTRPAVVSSRSPVGSSANSSRGEPTSARANATRCCSPPDNSPGRWSLRSSRSTSLSQLDATASDSRLFVRAPAAA